MQNVADGGTMHPERHYQHLTHNIERTQQVGAQTHCERIGLIRNTQSKLPRK